MKTIYNLYKKRIIFSRNMSIFFLFFTSAILAIIILFHIFKNDIFNNNLYLNISLSIVLSLIFTASSYIMVLFYLNYRINLDYIKDLNKDIIGVRAINSFNEANNKLPDITLDILDNEQNEQIDIKKLNQEVLEEAIYLIESNIINNKYNGFKDELFKTFVYLIKLDLEMIKNIIDKYKENDQTENKKNNLINDLNQIYQEIYNKTNIENLKLQKEIFDKENQISKIKKEAFSTHLKKFTFLNSVLVNSEKAESKNNIICTINTNIKEMFDNNNSLDEIKNFLIEKKDEFSKKVNDNIKEIKKNFEQLNKLKNELFENKDYQELLILEKRKEFEFKKRNSKNLEEYKKGLFFEGEYTNSIINWKDENLTNILNENSDFFNVLNSTALEINNEIKTKENLLKNQIDQIKTINDKINKLRSENTLFLLHKYGMINYTNKCIDEIEKIEKLNTECNSLKDNLTEDVVIIKRFSINGINDNRINLNSIKDNNNLSKN